MYNFWPNKKKKIRLKFNKVSLEQVEERYKKKINWKYLLYFSSGRSAIVSCLKSFQLKRDNKVGFSPFSNACIFRTVGEVSTPIPLNMKENFNACLLHHQWGYVQNYKSSNSNIIEDSIDSFFVNKNALFPNNGVFEIVSLSKIFGIPYGAIVFCKNKASYLNLKKVRNLNKKITISQYILKFLSNYNLNAKTYWDLGETNNAYPGNGLNDLIIDCLENYDEIINDRLRKIKILEKNLLFKVDPNRLPIIIPLKVNKEKIKKIKKLKKFLFLERHLNTTFNLKTWKLKKFFPLPIHQDVDIKTIYDIKNIINS